jgi:hypothetical protein
VTPDQWLAELEQIVALQPNQMREQVRAQAEQLAAKARASAQTGHGAIRSVSLTPTPDGARVTVTGTSAAATFVETVLSATKVGAISRPLLSGDGVVLSQ